MGDRGGTKTGSGHQAAISLASKGQLPGDSGALAEARRQRDTLSTPVKIASVLAPGPIGTALTIGNAMGAASEGVLAKNPDKLKTIPGQPGGVYGNVGGVDYSNRADYPGSDKTGRGNARRRGDRIGGQPFSPAATTLYS